MFSYLREVEVEGGGGWKGGMEVGGRLKLAFQAVPQLVAPMNKSQMRTRSRPFQRIQDKLMEIIYEIPHSFDAGG